LLGRAHLNLIDSSRQLLELDPGAEAGVEDGWLFCAGSASHPVIANAAFRRDDAVEGEALVSRASEFFGARERGFSIWVRAGLEEDRDLAEAAAAAGFQDVYGMPEMVLREAVEPPALSPRAELRRLAAAEEAEEYWQVATAAYASLGFPPEIFSGYTNGAGLLADNVAAFIARLDGRPVSIAMTIVSHGVAGVYWVGSLEDARGLGLGRAVTTAATNAGFALGAEIASLQASPMGKPIYEAMGYETAFEYRMLMSPVP
jgi:ribosomal protein S18 acetylase RimI-like enzyme